ncbi:MAG TPA: sulfotransferase [Gammaproteobacteria bacterium]
MAEHLPTAEIHRLLGEAAAAFARGELQRAAAACQQVLQAAPEMPDALHLLALCLFQSGDAGNALRLIRHAAGLKPGDPQLLRNLGVVAAEAGDAGGALTAFTRLTLLDPADAEAQFNLAVLSENLGDLSGAEHAYRETLRRMPRYAAAAGALAALLEQRNVLEEAARWSGEALAADPAEPVANLTQAQLDFRAGREAEAAARLERLLTNTKLTPRNRALAAGRLGAVYDRLDRPAEAWPQFLAAKQALQATLPPQPEGAYGFAAAARMARHAGALLAPGPVAEGATPVFLVGFPRSGTTLLDQILSGHPGIAVLEEQDTLQDVLHEHALSDEGLQAFLKLDAPGLAARRRAYWQRVAELMPQRPAGALFVDKLPLNSVFMPLIRRLFPSARFIFALRDPRDAVLSCFMQTFGLNEAMRHFLSLEETARYYAAVMGVGHAALERLPEAAHRIRYEDVVADTEGEARRLLAFLGLAWEPKVLDFQESAKNKRINTPSYSQVTQPIYTRARERWRKYETQLAPVLPVLEPFVDKFGYR